MRGSGVMRGDISSRRCPYGTSGVASTALRVGVRRLCLGISRPSMPVRHVRGRQYGVESVGLRGCRVGAGLGLGWGEGFGVRRGSGKSVGAGTGRA
eukprot:5946851-Prymnesium_polylepis.1